MVRNPEGISLYDGERMTVFKAARDSDTANETDVLPGNSCDFIRGNKEGDIFFRCDNSLVKYDIRKQSFRVVREGNVRTLAESDGSVWCAIGDSIYIYNVEAGALQFKWKTGLEEDINCLLVSDGETWIGTQGGLYCLEEGKPLRCVIEGKDIYSLFRSSSREIWAGRRMDGLYRIRDGGETLFYQEGGKNPAQGIASNQIREFVEDAYGNIWFGTFRGLQKYNPYTDEFTVYRQHYLPGDISHVSVFSLCIDRQGTIWAGTYYGGVNYFNRESDIFSHYVSNPGREECLSYPFVGRMVEDKQGRVWICTEGGGLNCLDRKSLAFKVYAKGSSNGLEHDNLKSICYDSIRDRLYIGTHTGGLYHYDIARNVFHNYLADYKEGDAKPDHIIHQTAIFRNCLIVAARNGLFSMDLETGRFEQIYGTCLNFSIDSKGMLWLSTYTHIMRINLDNLQERQEIRLSQYGIRFQSTRIIESHGHAYIGTLGSGLYKYDETSGTFAEYTAGSGHLLSNYCYDIAETRQGHLLITSDKGITLFNPALESSKFIKLGVNLPITSITEGCGVLACRNGELFIGGTDGLASFREEDLDRAPKDYALYFSRLLVNNKPVHPGDAEHILEQALPYAREVRLKHNRNNLIVDFATGNYINLQREDEYEYKLEGLDREWLSTSLTRVYYTNLSPGNYTLKVREKNMRYPDAPQEISLPVVISPAWYNTYWAWALYLSVAAGLFFFWLRAKRIRRALLVSLEKERAEKEKHDEINEAKLRFFTNISHEFRTPLTLIISQVELLLQGHGSLAPLVYSKILKVRKNALHMMGLITELLDFRKLEDGLTALRISEQNLVPYLHDIFLSFNELAAKQSIAYTFRCTEEEILLWYDPAQLQKVFFNLLSNAFKFTPSGGSIELIAAQERGKVSVKVIDSGVGLSAEDAAHIFERFYQAKDRKNVPPGTGIGLALSKNIVSLHHGQINVTSRLDYGSVFVVELPGGKDSFLNDPNVLFVQIPDDATPAAGKVCDAVTPDEYQELLGALPSPEGKKKYTVLIVEDNEELFQTLYSLFAPLYDVLLAQNGAEGLEKAATMLPDLVVSDVMMPVMDGIELCKCLKSNIDTCHIPFVLLTAFHTTEHNLEGLKQGADDYIGKPFHSRLLLTRCNNLVRNRLLMQNRLSKEVDFGLNLLATNPLDKDLLDRATDCIEKQIGNPDLDVNYLARKLCLGRSTLFVKFKALAGMTPNDFIQDQRLKRAALLLRNHPEKQITEISDALGFCSQVYFSRCFKSKFGQSPNMFRKQMNNG
ncbi:hybrid sensor histidine kinase/response regulator [Bacteroidia bacterium]|nr:hybrid sensor histidine kinase/response regulator [Bacteroidia bacterium]